LIPFFILLRRKRNSKYLRYKLSHGTDVSTCFPDYPK